MSEVGWQMSERSQMSEVGYQMSEGKHSPAKRDLQAWD